MQWYWECLVDGDIALNPFNWQWIAGSGADGAPFFRIFNPILQAKKFDPDGSYVKKWLPQLNNLPADIVHNPWQASGDLTDYYQPIVDHQQARKKALSIFKKTNTS